MDRRTLSGLAYVPTRVQKSGTGSSRKRPDRPAGVSGPGRFGSERPFAA